MMAMAGIILYNIKVEDKENEKEREEDGFIVLTAEIICDHSLCHYHK